MFWLGLVVGYILGNVVAFLIECLCLISKKSDIDKWMYEEVESELNRSKEETTTPRD